MSVDRLGIEPPEWFWESLESNRPQLSNLETWLMNASIERVREFAAWYDLASQEVWEYSNGPEGYSEDNNEDICSWIVGQGHKLWQMVVTDEIAYTDILLLKEEERLQELPVEIREWKNDNIEQNHHSFQSPAYIASSVFFTRCGKEIWDEEQDEIMERILDEY